jgi:hypothetical protein
MIRNLTIVAVASFVLFVGCLAGAFALGGRDIMQHGWTFPADWNIEVNDDNDHVHIGPGSSTPTTARPPPGRSPGAARTPCRSTCRPR